MSWLPNILKRIVRIAACAIVPFAFEVEVEASGEERRHPANHLSVLEGVAIELGPIPHFAESIGADYEHRIDATQQFVGVELVAEVSMFTHPKVETLVGIVIHPARGFRTGVGAGIAYVNLSFHALARFFTGYDFSFGNVTFGPEIDMDFVNHHRCLIGAFKLGYGF